MNNNERTSEREDKTINIYDIAKLSGVSIATVSRVVNGSPRVSEKTKQKVLAVMKENDYTPNVFARGLGLDSMKTVGIICPDIWQEPYLIWRAVCTVMDMIVSWDAVALNRKKKKAM